jgi:hypothetical protein
MVEGKTVRHASFGAAFSCAARYHGRMNRPSLYHVLRITASAVCGVVCVLLVVLWVRSYYWHDYVQRVGRTSHLRITSGGGKVVFNCDPLDPAVLYGSLPSYGSEKQTLSRDFYLRAFPGQFGHLPIITDVGSYHDYWVPLWFLTLVFAALAAAPWLYWSTRFSLRTLFIVVTVVALGLGLEVYFARG